MNPSYIFSILIVTAIASAVGIWLDKSFSESLRVPFIAILCLIAGVLGPVAYEANQRHQAEQAAKAAAALRSTILSVIVEHEAAIAKSKKERDEEVAMWNSTLRGWSIFDATNSETNETAQVTP